MKSHLVALLLAGQMMACGAAQAACGDISIAAFNWQSAEVLSYVDQFVLNKGYGCNATIVAGDTVPTTTSVIEKGEPDIAPGLNPYVVGALYTKAVAEGRIVKIGSAITEGTLSGWYIPKYFADAHLDIKTVDDALKHPELFPAPEDPSKGGVLQGPQGWGDTIVTAQLFKALHADQKGFVLVPTGSAAALDGAISRAYERKQGFITFYWSPTSLLAKYPMVRLEGVKHDDAEWLRCTSKQDCPDPRPNYWQRADDITVASGPFMKRNDIGPLKEYFAKRQWSQEKVGRIMLWMTENQANGQDGARWFFQNMPDVWTRWVPAEVAAKIKAAL